MIENIANILEIFMLVCFGLSWPIAAVKSYKSRSSKTTSLPFIFLVLAGYVAGVTAKFISGNVNYVLFAYLINILSVCTNIVVYFINRHREKNEKREEREKEENFVAAAAEQKS